VNLASITSRRTVEWSMEVLIKSPMVPPIFQEILWATGQHVAAGTFSTWPYLPKICSRWLPFGQARAASLPLGHRSQRRPRQRRYGWLAGRGRRAGLLDVAASASWPTWVRS
jgi:hypothetical protein